MDIIVKESPSKKIIISHGEDIKESEFIEGRISSLQLSADGKEAVYVTDNQTIHLLNTITGITELILELDKPIQFVKIINLHNCNMVLCKWEENNLKVCILNSWFNLDSFSSCYYIYRLYAYLFNFNCNYKM